MQQLVFTHTEPMRLVIEHCRGNVRLRPAPDATLRIQADERSVQAQQQNGTVTLQARGSVSVAVPVGTTVLLGDIAGNVSARGIGPLNARSVAGLLEARGVTSLAVERLAGDLIIEGVEHGVVISHFINGDAVARGVGGDFTAERINGDLRLQGIGGPVTIRHLAGDAALGGLDQVALDRVQGDLTASRLNALRAGGVAGDVQVAHIGEPVQLGRVDGDLSAYDVPRGLDAPDVSGDAEVQTRLEPGAVLRVIAKGDIRLGLPPETSAQVSVRGSRIKVDDSGLPLQLERLGDRLQGRLGDGEATIDLVADGTIKLGRLCDRLPRFERRLVEDLGLDEIGRVVADAVQAARTGLELVGPIEDAVREAMAGFEQELRTRSEERARRIEERARERAERIRERVEARARERAERLRRRLERQAAKLERQAERVPRRFFGRWHFAMEPEEFGPPPGVHPFPTPGPAPRPRAGWNPPTAAERRAAWEAAHAELQARLAAIETARTEFEQRRAAFEAAQREVERHQAEVESAEVALRELERRQAGAADLAAARARFRAVAHGIEAAQERLSEEAEAMEEARAELHEREAELEAARAELAEAEAAGVERAETAPEQGRFAPPVPPVPPAPPTPATGAVAPPHVSVPPAPNVAPPPPPVPPVPAAPTAPARGAAVSAATPEARPMPEGNSAGGAAPGADAHAVTNANPNAAADRSAGEPGYHPSDVPAAAGVADEARLNVLRRVAAGELNVEEAERILEALDREGV